MLSPCLSCSRLVRGTDTACPFCKRPFSPTGSRTVGRRVTRAAAIAAVAAMGVACGGTVAPTGDAGADAAPPDAAANDAKADAPPPADAGFIDQIAVPPYGVPPTDGGK